MTKQQIDAALVEQTAQEIAGAFGVPAAHWQLMEHKHREQYRTAAKIGLQRGLSLQQTGKVGDISSPAQEGLKDARMARLIMKDLLDELWDNLHSHMEDWQFENDFAEAVAFCSWESRHE